MKNTIQMKTMSLVMTSMLVLLMSRPAHANPFDKLPGEISGVVSASMSGVKDVLVKLIEEKTKQNITEGCLAKLVGTKEGFILTSCLGAAVVIGGLTCYKLASRLSSVKVGKFEVTVKFADGSTTRQEIEVLDPTVVTPSMLTPTVTAPVCPSGN